jgi:hypothetical protein
MPVKIDKLDAVFSKIIRLRAGYRCEVCRTAYPDGGKGLHCSHHWSRRHQSTRYDFDNASSMCWGCHQKLGGNPIQFQSWIESYLGETRYALLNERHQQIKNRTKHDREELYQHLRGELAKLEADAGYWPVNYD